MSRFSSQLANSFGTGTAFAFIVVLLLFFLVLGPWLLFWSIGTMAAAAGYTVAIPLTFKTWLAGTVFLLCVRGASSSSSK